MPEHKLAKSIGGNLVWQDFWYSLLSISLSLLVGAMLIVATDNSPEYIYRVLLYGAFGSVQSIANTVAKATPLIFTGLAVALSFRCGLFNIGAEGQLFIAGCVAGIVGVAFGFLPVPIVFLLCVFLGVLAGMVYAAVPGFLKAKYGIHEVVVTVMLNYVATYFTAYLVNYPLKAKDSWVAQTELLPQGLWIPTLVPRTQLSAGIFIALATCIVLYFFLFKTSWGFEIRAVGENPTAAEAGGISIVKNMTLAMALSGGIAGLAGVVQTMGVYHRFIEGFSPGWGFTGIAVAVLGKNHPFGVILTALLFGALDAGAIQLGRLTNLPANMVVVIQGLVIIFVAAPDIFKFLSRKRGGWHRCK